MIYESRVNYCHRLYEAKTDGVFAPTVPEVSGSSLVGEDSQSNDSFFGWMVPAYKDIWTEMQSLKPGARMIDKQNERYVIDLPTLTLMSE